MLMIGVGGLFISGCGKSVKGTYVNSETQMTIEIKSGGKASLTLAGMTHEADYTVDDNKLTIKSPGDTTTFLINSDGSISSEDKTMTFKKQ
ncbi:MAG TPA: hypothetical protein VKK61_02565 [Tepidisphaeraceae bacterium]|nr:hypothetical protein [Tepidisphaeraceae bacterium]